MNLKRRETAASSVDRTDASASGQRSQCGRCWDSAAARAAPARGRRTVRPELYQAIAAGPAELDRAPPRTPAPRPAPPAGQAVPAQARPKGRRAVSVPRPVRAAAPVAPAREPLMGRPAPALGLPRGGPVDPSGPVPALRAPAAPPPEVAGLPRRATAE